VPNYTNNNLTCPGPSQNFTITVNPTPIVNQISDITYCNSFLTNEIILSGTGTSYNWTNNNAAIGLGANGINTVPAFTTVNNNNASATSATVVITPIYTNAGITCQGPISDFIISVNPTTIIADPVDQVICNNAATQLINFSGTGTSYLWTNNNISIGLGGSGIGNILPFNVQIQALFQ
jgi:hypothetical protein